MKKLCVFLACFVLLGMSIVQAQTVRVTGTVTSSEDGMPIPGVSVIVKGTTVGASTDVDGKFAINAPSDATTLVFSFIGMKTQEVVIGGRSVVNVVMEPAVQEMGEVVVTALGIKRETKALGYSVQTVKSEDMVKSGAVNPVNALSGKVAGVQVTNSAGMAGASSFIVIRGMSSITQNNQPLFIVDGIPIDNSQLSTETLTAGVAYSNRAIDLNPDDIENISVLKGGAATALYGLRAANGVIMITTKKGVSTKGKKLNVSYSSTMAIEQVSQMYPMQLTYAQGLGGAYVNNTTSAWGPLLTDLRHSKTITDPYMWDEKLKIYKGVLVPATSADAGEPVFPVDNINNFFVNGLTYNNNVSLSGGTEKTTFFFSAGHLKSSGVVPMNEWTRSTFTLNAETKLADWLTTGAKITYTNSGGYRIQQGSNTSGVMLSLLRMAPNFDNAAGYTEPWKHEGSYIFPDRSQRNQHRGGGYDNPYWVVNNNPFKDVVNRVTTSFNTNIRLAEWANLIYRVGNDWYSDRRKQVFEIGSRTFAAGRIIEDQYFVHDINQDIILSLNREIISGLNGTLMIGHNMYQTQYQNIFARGSNLNIYGFQNISNATTIEAFDTKSQKRTAAVYSDFGLAYQSMVFMNVTLRNEWSTTLPEANNSFFFPSVNGSFVFTELAPLKDNNIITFGKLRASFAKIANDAFAYGTNATFPSAAFTDGWTTSAISFPAFGTAGFTLGNTLPNKNLKPESSKTWEVGTDLRFLGGRIGIDFTYYETINSDLILSVPVAKSSGFYAANMNAATMENKGIEAVLLLTPVKTSDFSWDLNLNFTKNKNEVVSLAEGVPNVFLGGFTSAQARAVVGNSYGSIFGSDFLRDAKGQVVIDDRPLVNNAPNSRYGWPMLASSDAALGDVLPEWTMAITNSLEFKGLRFSFMFDIKKGGYMWNGTKGAMYQFGTHKDTEERGGNVVYKGVKFTSLTNNVGTVPNDVAMNLSQAWFQDVGGGFFGAGSQFVEKTDWVRLREVSISYSLPKGLLQKTFIDGAEVYFTGRNLWLSTPYTGIDPETSLYGSNNAQGMDYFNMPGTKTYTFGLKLNF